MGALTIEQQIQAAINNHKRSLNLDIDEVKLFTKPTGKEIRKAATKAAVATARDNSDDLVMIGQQPFHKWLSPATNKSINFISSTFIAPFFYYVELSGKAVKNSTQAAKYYKDIRNGDTSKATCMQFIYAVIKTGLAASGAAVALVTALINYVEIILNMTGRASTALKIAAHTFARFGCVITGSFLVLCHIPGMIEKSRNVMQSTQKAAKHWENKPSYMAGNNITQALTCLKDPNSTLSFAQRNAAYEWLETYKKREDELFLARYALTIKTAYLFIDAISAASWLFMGSGGIGIAIAIPLLLLRMALDTLVEIDKNNNHAYSRAIYEKTREFFRTISHEYDRITSITKEILTNRANLSANVLSGLCRFSMWAQGKKLPTVAPKAVSAMVPRLALPQPKRC